MTADKTSFLPGGVDYLLRHPAEIDWNSFIRVSDERVVDLAISQMADANSPLCQTYPRCERSLNGTMFWTDLARNTCSKAVELVIEHMNKVLCDGESDDETLTALSGNTNDNAVEWLIEDPDNIDMDEFMLNTCPRAVGWVIYNVYAPSVWTLETLTDSMCQCKAAAYNEHVERKSGTLGIEDIEELNERATPCIVDDSTSSDLHHLPIELIDVIGEYDDHTQLRGHLKWHLLDKQQLCLNEHPAAVRFLLSHTKYIDWDFARCNQNDDMVKTVLKSKPTTLWYGNRSDIAVAYIMNHLDSANYDDLSCNGNTQIVDYLFNHQDKIVWTSFMQHDDTRMGKLFVDCKMHAAACDMVTSQNGVILSLALSECDNIITKPQIDRTQDEDQALWDLNSNSHPLAVEWLFAHPYEILSSAAFDNADDRIVSLTRKLHRNELPVFNGKSKNQFIIDWMCDDYTYLSDDSISDMSSNPLIFKHDAARRKWLISII